MKGKRREESSDFFCLLSDSSYSFIPMADIHDSVSGTNQDDEFLYSMLAIDPHEIDNQGDHDPLCCSIVPLQIPEGTSAASTSIMENDWDWLLHSQPGNTDHEWPAASVAASEGNTIRNHQEETLNVEMDNSIKYLPSCDIPILSVEKDGDDVIPFECSEDEIQSEPTFKLKEVDSQVPEIGMVFSSEEEAYNFYITYAKEIGFNVRKGKVQRLVNGTIRKRFFICSRQGFRLQKQSTNTTKYWRKETRTGCDAMVQFTIKNGRWVISSFNPEHNHDLEAKSKLVEDSSTNISEDHSPSTTLNKARIVKETGAANSVGFHSVDCSSFLQDENINCPQLVDGQSLIDYFRHLQLEDPSYFLTVQVNDKNCITNFFWMDGRSKIDYGYFGDVVIFDTTLRIDAYNMICALFLGINHHGKCILFGGALLLDNSINSFIWLFRNFLEAMGNCQPKTIFTDDCQTISDAIEVVLPMTRHLLGLRYILQNAEKHLSSNYGQPGFDSLFNKCIYDCESEEEFESMWRSLLQQHNLCENSWLKDLYTLRRKWSHYACKQIFSAGIRTTQGYESVCKIFHSFNNETLNPLQFVQLYSKLAAEQRREELYEDLRCNGNAGAVILRNNAMEKEAAKIYTCTMFKLFQQELLDCLSVAIEEIPSDGMTTTFKLTEGDHRKEKIVEFNSLESHVTCSCKKYESVGILCVHALKVLIARNIFQIPSQYILKRWMKSAKDGMIVDGHEEEVVIEGQRQLLFPKSRLMHNALNVITKGLAVEETWMIVEDHLKMALKKVEDVLRNKNIGNLSTTIVDVHGNNDAGSENHVGCMETQEMIANPSSINQQEVSTNGTKSKLKRKHENEVREINCKFSDGIGVIAHQQPIKEVTKGGYQGSRKGASHSCIGENSRQLACMSSRPPLPSQSTFQKTRGPSKSLGNIQETKKQALHFMANRLDAAEKRIMLRVKELQKEMLEFRYEKHKIFTSLNAVNSCHNQTTKKNKFICQMKSALQHQLEGIGEDNVAASNTGVSVQEQNAKQNKLNTENFRTGSNFSCSE